jgi:glycosyltransferase involved in cell wall biosynthesis
VSDAESEDDVFAEVGGIRVSNLGRKISILGDIQSIFEFRRALRQIRPDVLNTHTAKAGLIGRVAAIGLDCKVVHTFHGHLLYGYFSPFKTALVIRLERFLNRFTDGYIFVGEKVRLDLLSRGIGNGKPYQVILPAIDFSKFNVIKSQKLLASSGEDGQLVVGWLGRLTPIKRVDRVISLAKMLPEVEFIIGGSGDINPVDFKEITKNIEFIGWISPENFWNRCDIGILTSDNEGVPTSLIEAAASGIPVISYDVGSVSEIIQDRATGFLVKDLQQMKDKISELSSDRANLLKMGELAHQIAVSRFDKSTFLRAHNAIYSMVTDSPIKYRG